MSSKVRASISDNEEAACCGPLHVSGFGFRPKEHRTQPPPSPDEVLQREREKAKDYPFGKESPHLPQWQLDELKQHRRLRKLSSQSADLSKIIWTRNVGLEVQYGPMAAAGVIATVPSILLAVFARRSLIEGFRSLAGIS
ncbi:MAG: hypothetical protein JO207_08930 [Verrucomicrobia bacterium]|nr:hypothetical protein [Verrucomicrobiota bacterium]